MKSALLLPLLLAAAGCKTSGSKLPTCQTLNDAGALVAATPPNDMGAAGVSCFYATTTVATRTACTSAIGSFCDTSGTATPNVACDSPPPPPELPDGGPFDLAVAPDLAPEPRLQTVRLVGFVHVFDNGGNGDAVTLSIYNGTQLQMGTDPSSLVPLGSTQVLLYTVPTTAMPTRVPIFPWAACDKDLTKGCSVAITQGCAVPCNDGVNNPRDDGKYCRDDGNGGTCSDRLRWEASYAQVGVPVGEPLVLRVTGAGGKPDSSWATVLQWNAFIPTQANGRVCSSHLDSECYDGADYRINITAMSQFDYSHLPAQAGLPGGISFDHGMLIGEVHDCDGVRLQNAEVALTPAADRFAYFDGNPFKMTPDVRRFMTDPLGRYAAFNLPAGKVTVAAGGIVGNGAPFVTFGSASAFILANSVSLLNINSGF